MFEFFLVVIGVTEVPVSTLTVDNPVEKWQPLSKLYTDLVTGDIHLVITKKDSGLLVRLIECRNVAAQDPNGKSDPYVKFSFGRSKKKSKTIKKTLSPVYNEEFDLSGDTSQLLKIRVFDWDRLGGDDFLYVNIYFCLPHFVLGFLHKFLYLKRGKVDIDCSSFPLNVPVDKFYLLERQETPEELRAIEEKRDHNPGLGDLRYRVTYFVGFFFTFSLQIAKFNLHFFFSLWTFILCTIM